MQAVRRIAPTFMKYTTRMYNPARYFGGRPLWEETHA